MGQAVRRACAAPVVGRDPACVRTGRRGRELLGVGQCVAIAVSLEGHLGGSDLGDDQRIGFVIRTVKELSLLVESAID